MQEENTPTQNNENEELGNKSFYKSLILFITGYLGLNIFAYLFMLFFSLVLDFSVIREDIVQYTKLSCYINFLAYITTLVTLFFIMSKKEFLRTFKGFIKGNKVLKGIGYGFGLLAISFVYSMLIYKLRPTTTSNENESSLEIMIQTVPVFAFAFVVILAPLTEEITYRYSLFGAIYKKNKILAYIITAIVFGAIHCSFLSFGSMTKDEIINELINLPSYIISGAYLCFVYDKEKDLAVSTTAHLTNNLIAFLSTIAAMSSPEVSPESSSLVRILLGLIK